MPERYKVEVETELGNEKRLLYNHDLRDIGM